MVAGSVACCMELHQFLGGERGQPAILSTNSDAKYGRQGSTSPVRAL